MKRPLVLVAEDDPGMAELLRYRLEHAGCAVVIAGDGQSAWSVVLNRRPEVSLLDRGLPALDGMEVLRRIRSTPSTASSYVVIISGREGMTDGSSESDFSPDGYLQKPVDPDVVLAHVATRVGLTVDDMTELGDAPSEQPFDLDLVERWLAGDMSRVRAHVEAFIDGHTDRLAQLTRAHAEDDVEAVAATSHRIAGALANLGARRAASAMRDVEESAKRGEEVDLTISTTSLCATVEALTDWLYGERSEQDGE